MKLLLIDDHALFREGLALLLRPLVQNSLVLEAGSCEQAKEVLSAQPEVELVLMDLGLPGMSGLDGIAWLHDTQPGLPVVALSSADDRDTVLQALDAGAMGFIPKSASSAVMLGALQVVLAGGIYLPQVVLPQGTRPVTGASAPAPRGAAPEPGSTAWPAKPPTPPTPADLGLTPRQADVLDLLLQGKPAKLICRELGLAQGTVKAHTSAVLRALNVTTRVQAVVAASRLGWRLKQGGATWFAEGPPAA